MFKRRQEKYHKQEEQNINKENLPNYWVNNLNEIILC